MDIRSLLNTPAVPDAGSASRAQEESGGSGSSQPLPNPMSQQNMAARVAGERTASQRLHALNNNGLEVLAEVAAHAERVSPGSGGSHVADQPPMPQQNMAAMVARGQVEQDRSQGSFRPLAPRNLRSLLAAPVSAERMPAGYGGSHVTNSAWGNAVHEGAGSARQQQVGTFSVEFPQRTGGNVNMKTVREEINEDIQNNIYEYLQGVSRPRRLALGTIGIYSDNILKVLYSIQAEHGEPIDLQTLRTIAANSEREKNASDSPAIRETKLYFAYLCPRPEPEPEPQPQPAAISSAKDFPRHSGGRVNIEHIRRTGVNEKVLEDIQKHVAAETKSTDQNSLKNDENRIVKTLFGIQLKLKREQAIDLQWLRTIAANSEWETDVSDLDDIKYRDKRMTRRYFEYLRSKQEQGSSSQPG